MVLKERNNVHCDWFENPNREWLKNVWQSLELTSDASIFLSWLWIGTWLECFVENFHVIEARRNGITVGLGIIVTERSSLLSSRLKVKHYLHRTGVTSEDQVWIEYNDFLISSHNSEEIRNAMFSSVTCWMGKYDAFVVGASRTGLFSASCNIKGLYEREIWRAKSYSVELNTFLGKPKLFLQSLSRNSRYQISRSLRKYKEIGPVVLDTMTTKEDAIELLRLAGFYHKSRWENTASGSGFTNEKFILFHTQLIQQAFLSGHIQLHHVKAGSETIGIVYNFKYRERVYFYLCALNYHHTNSSSHYKPGLVSHYLLIEKAIGEGVELYDFMGGDARYKRTFANRVESLAVYRYEHCHWLCFIEHYAREIKHKLMIGNKS